MARFGQGRLQLVYFQRGPATTRGCDFSRGDRGAGPLDGAERGQPGFPSNSFTCSELRFLQSQGPESTCSNHYITFHHQEQCPLGAARRLGWRHAWHTALPSSGKASQKLPGMPLPQHITKQTQSAAQSKHGRESERTCFVCRGRRTVEQRKKQAELSAISCFLGLAPSFLRGGPGRFVLVPSCFSAPLSGGLCRPWRNAALGPQGTWLRAPPAR